MAAEKITINLHVNGRAVSQVMGAELVAALRNAGVTLDEKSEKQYKQTETEYRSGISGSQAQAEGYVHVFFPDHRQTIYHDDLCGTWDEVMADIHAIVHGEQPKAR